MEIAHGMEIGMGFAAGSTVLPRGTRPTKHVFWIRRQLNQTYLFSFLLVSGDYRPCYLGGLLYTDDRTPALTIISLSYNKLHPPKKQKQKTKQPSHRPEDASPSKTAICAHLHHHIFLCIIVQAAGSTEEGPEPESLRGRREAQGQKRHT